MRGERRHEAILGDKEKPAPLLIDRSSLCLPDFDTGVFVHNGNVTFERDVRRHYAITESNVSERTMELKRRLRTATTHDFWMLLMEGMTSIVDAQYGFVAKRILVDDENSAVEMPPLGEPGSCLMGLAYYYNDGGQQTGMFRDYKYLAYGAPCAGMRHEKVLLIPERLDVFTPGNVNKFPFPADAYLGIPLFAEGKCFAHFGLMWTPEANKRRDLSWGFLELFLHSLEDLILQRILDGDNFARSTLDKPGREKVIPQDAVDNAKQSLRPYARSLSHELRTPMQGVVGMLDVMHSTVQGVVEDSRTDRKMRNVLRSLRENIEIVQGNSRRAVEAADNVVHAYDLNMEVPDSPTVSMQDAQREEDVQKCIATTDPSSAVIAESQTSVRQDNARAGSKRQRRSSSLSAAAESEPATKQRVLHDLRTPPPLEGRRKYGLRTEGRTGSAGTPTRAGALETDVRCPAVDIYPVTPTDEDDRASFMGMDHIATTSSRHTKLRDLLRDVIDESLHVGGRPESTLVSDTNTGEHIVVRSRDSKGQAKSKVIEWTVDPAVPETMLLDERDLSKLVSCVFLNALKFTERGTITLAATISQKSRLLIINVRDTGLGIPQDFLPSIFKPFSREDESLTRQTDGLGLGLLVAKGLVRKIGGDLACVRSETSGPNHGTDFEIRIPISPTDLSSGPSTPSRSNFTPTISVSQSSLDVDVMEESTAPSQRRRSSRHSSPILTSRTNLGSHRTPPRSCGTPRSMSSSSSSNTPRMSYDRHLAIKDPLTFLVAEDNRINRQLLVTMLRKFGYTDIQEAYDGAEAVRQMTIERSPAIDVVLMDLWMPNMDGYEATERILRLPKFTEGKAKPPAILAVTADVTTAATQQVQRVGMKGLMTKPYKLLDLERLILDCCHERGGRRNHVQQPCLPRGEVGSNHGQ